MLFVVFLHKSHAWEKSGFEIWAKMYSANQIGGVLNQLYF